MRHPKPTNRYVSAYVGSVKRTIARCCVIWLSIGHTLPATASIRVPQVPSRQLSNPQAQRSVSLLSPHQVPPGQVLMQWFQKGMALGKLAGLTQKQTALMLRAMWFNSVRQDNDFLHMVVCISFVESRMRHNRVSSAGAVGVMQVTPIAAADVGAIEWTTLAGNIRTGTQYLLQTYEARANWPVTLAQYNGGYRAVLAMQRAEQLPNETAQYIAKVLGIYYQE